MNYLVWLAAIMEFKLVGAPIALYKEFETGAEKGVSEIRKILGISFQSLNLNNCTQEAANDKIYAKEKRLMNKYRSFFIGGDHSITYPILKAQTKPFDVFWFDAHPDLYDFYKHKFSHATVMRRILELHNCRTIYLIGNRAIEPEEKEFLKDTERVKRIHFNQIKRTHSRRYYVTIDMDVLDPSEAPAVDHPVPRGLSMTQLISSIKHLKKGNLIGCDLVEVVPDNDSSGITEKNAVKIIKTILNS